MERVKLEKSALENLNQWLISVKILKESDDKDLIDNCKDFKDLLEYEIY